jgi:hypothetical protein
MDELTYTQLQRARDDQMASIQFSHFKWMTYTFRFLCMLFFISSCIEVLRLSADDHADFQYAYHNPPLNCLKEQVKSTWSWSIITTTIVYPFKSIYQSIFEPPVSSDCIAYFRKTNPMLLYFPRIPQAISNVIANFFLTPFVMFLNKFGDALRDFLDKFNVAERFFGIIILLFGMILSSICFVSIIWIFLRQTPQLSQQSKQSQQAQANQLTYKKENEILTPRKRRSNRFLGVKPDNETQE